MVVNPDVSVSWLMFDPVLHLARFARSTPNHTTLKFGLFAVYEQPICLGERRVGITLRSAGPAVLGEYPECE